MSYAVTQKQSESPYSSSVRPSLVLSVPLGVASTLSQSAPEKSSEGAWSTAQQARLPFHARLQDHGRAWIVFQYEEARLPPPLPPPLPHQSQHLLHLVAVRLPLLLAFTSTSFFFFGLFLRPVGHRVHLGSDLEDNKQDKGHSTELQQSGMKKTESQSEKCGQTLSGS